jgi:hypothetical protein
MGINRERGMKTTAGLLTVMCAGVWCQLAWADDPPPPPATSSAQQTATSPATAPAAQPNAATPAADANSVKPGVTVVGAKAELSPPEKELLSRGYKLEMHNGQKYFCRREEQMGSRFAVKNCDTAESIEAHRQASQEALRAIQSDRAKSSN